MATPAIAPVKASLKATEDCVFITTSFRMGIGRMRQVNHLEVTTNADKTQLRHQKKMIDSPELDEIRSQDGYMKRHLDSISCRYSEATRFLPKTELAKTYKALVAYQTIRRPKLVGDFMAKYRALEAVDFAPLALPAPDGLGDLFDRGDYPNSDTVEAGFAMEFYIHNVGAIDLQGLPDFIVAMELEKEQTKRAAAVDEWTRVMRVALAGVVDNLFEVLKPEDGKKRKLYDTHVDNLVEFCRTFPSRNLGGDEESAKLVGQIASLMNGVSPDSLRHSDNLKAHVAEQLTAVRAGLKTLVIETTRKFR
jgi:hypothetical protein